MLSGRCSWPPCSGAQRRRYSARPGIGSAGLRAVANVSTSRTAVMTARSRAVSTAGGGRSGRRLVDRAGPEPEPGPDLAGGGGPVQRVEVQPRHTLGEQPLAQPGGVLDPHLANRDGVVLDRVELGGEVPRERGTGQLRGALDAADVG